MPVDTAGSVVLSGMLNTSVFCVALTKHGSETNTPYATSPHCASSSSVLNASGWRSEYRMPPSATLALMR